MKSVFIRTQQHMLFDIWRKKKDMALKLCQMIELYVRKFFMEKSCRNHAPKVSPRPLLKFGK